MMLTFLLPSVTSAARGSTHLARRLSVSTTRQQISSRRQSSTIVGHASLSSRSEEDTKDGTDPSHSQHKPVDRSTFSHFFDRQAPISQITSSSSKPKASYEIAAASRQVTFNFRQAIGTRDPAEIIAAYDDLVQAHQHHAEDVFNSTSRVLKASDLGFPTKKRDIQTAIRYVIQHSQREGSMELRHVEACQQMFRDMSQRFGFQIGATDLHRQLQICCLAKDGLIDPCTMFRQLRAKYPNWQTTSVEWNMVINHLVRRDLHAQAIEIYQEMLEFGVQPETPLRNTMIRVHLAVNNLQEADAHLEHLEQGQEQLEIVTLTITVEGLCKLVSASKGKEKDLAMDKLRRYGSELRGAVEALPVGTTDSTAWNTLLRYEAIVFGVSHALKSARKASESDAVNSTTLNVLLRAHVDELKELQNSDEALELLERVQSAIDPLQRIQPDDRCYNTLMLGLLQNSAAESAPFDDDAADFALDEGTPGNTVQPGRSTPTPNQVREAQLLYDHVRSLGIPRTPLLVTPLLRAYCEAFLPSLPSAMKLVQDMLEHRSTSANVTLSRRGASSQRKSIQPPAIGMRIVQPVLEACIRLRDITSAFKLLSLIQDTSVSISASHKTELMQQLLRITNSWMEAFHVYRILFRFPLTTTSNSYGLDQRGYIIALETFRSLSFPNSPTAPPEHLLSILKDMRLSNFRPTPSIYTSILDHYSKTSFPSYLGIKATHEALKVDTLLEPDLPLINALMNAYNRAEEPAMVLAIWDSLLATRQEIDGVTLSVVFDTCGRFGLLPVARKVLARIRRLEEEAVGGRRGRSAMTKGAWDSWLECLARCGRLEEAIELVFGEMRRSLFRQALLLNDLKVEEANEVTVNDLVIRSTQAPVRDKNGHVVGPDSKTLSTLLKFAARERDRRQKCLSLSAGNSIWHTLRSRIREELSWIYPQIKSVGDPSCL